MGREIRMVPPGWEHPKKEVLRYTPGIGYSYVLEDISMHDRTFETAAAEWKAEYDKWQHGEFPEYSTAESREGEEFWEYCGMPPERQEYRPWKDEEATWFQLWQTVSEGTPVSPPFATREELASYLAENGDFWDQRRGNGGWGKEAADAFVEVGWAPSFMVRGGQMAESKDIPLVFGLGGEDVEKTRVDPDA